MTSKLTREKAQWLHDACEEAAAAGIKLTMNPNELLMFTSYALAAMDSDTVHSKPDIADAIYEAFIVVCECHPDSVSILRNARKYTDKIRHAQPAPVVLAIPDEMTAEQAYEIGDYHGDQVDVFARGANWMRQHIINSSLSVKNQEESANKWWHGLHNEIKGLGRRHEGDFTPDISMSTEEIIDAINKRRAAMLAAAPQPQNAQQNIPEIIPNELIAAVNRLLDSNGSRGCYSAIKCYDAHIEVECMLAAARQEVKP